MADVEVRSNRIAPEIGAESRKITGYAAVFESESEVLGGYDTDKGSYRFIETISRGAIDEALLSASDVRALVEHSPNRMVARSNKGKGSLLLSVDERGLRYEFEAPNTPDGDTVVELVRRGDFAGSSFAFTIKPGDTETTLGKDGVYRRKIKKITGLYDVSVVAAPAYAKTEVSLRSLQEETGETPEESDPRIKEYRKRILNK